MRHDVTVPTCAAGSRSDEVKDCVRQRRKRTSILREDR